MQRWLLEQLKLFCGDIRKAIATVVVVLVLGGTVGVVCLPKTALHVLAQLLSTPTPIWGTTAAVLLCCGYTWYTHRRSCQTLSESPPTETLVEAFGVYWNSDYKKRCLKCRWPLKCGRSGTSVFYCCNCDCKHALRDQDGNYLTESEAVKRLKASEQSDATERITAG